MKFETLVSSLDAEALAQTAETLLRLLSGGGRTEKIPSLLLSAPEREPRRPGALPLSAPGAAGPLPGAGSAEPDGPSAAETLPAPSAAPGGETAEAVEEAARAESRLDAPAERKPRSPEARAVEETTRLKERLAAVSERNRRALGVGPEPETVSPYASADGSAAAYAAAAGPEPFSAFPAPRAAVFGAEAGAGKTETETAPRAAGPAERGYFDAEAVSEFFRRDSRRYDSGFSD